MVAADVNGIRVEYEVAGDGEPLVLIMGIGAQLVQWPDGFLRQLHERGYRTIRFDNRDVGLSTHFSAARVPDARSLLTRFALGRPIPAPYTLSDMAADVAGLLDHLDLRAAHILGISMGGMIAQTFATEYPSRTLTLTSIMSTPGQRLHLLPRPHALAALLQPPPRSREQAMDGAVSFFRTVGGPAFPMDVADVRHRAGLAFDRNVDPWGFLRHMAAIFASGSRIRALRSLRLPALVIHGTADPLIPPRAGKATARAIPGAHLQMLRGMGHDFAPASWPFVVGALDALVRSRA